MLFKGWQAERWWTARGLRVPGGRSGGGAGFERLGRAKDYIADEQWARAIAELRTAVADPKEKSRDEALYWLAHSLNQSGDSAAAIATIRRLEREYPDEPVGQAGGIAAVGHRGAPAAQRRALVDGRASCTARASGPGRGAARTVGSTRRLRRHLPRAAASRTRRAAQPPPVPGHAAPPPPAAPPRRRSRHRRCRRPPGCPRATGLTPTCASRRSAG